MCRLGRKHVGKTTRTRKCKAEQNRTEELYFLTEKKKTDFKNCYIF